MKKRILCLILCIAMCMGMVSVFASCGGSGDNGDGVTPPPVGNDTVVNKIPVNKSAFVIMSEELDGLFNPFYSTSGADSTIVSMTQIGMLTSKFISEEEGVDVAYGENEAVVTKDLMIERDETADTTTYTFVLKNGIRFSDGYALTMEDVLFNLYVYLDPVYAGSATLYSTKILGLQSYRKQEPNADDDDTNSLLEEQAASRAENRLNFFVNLFQSYGYTGTDNKYFVEVEQMKEIINNLTIGEITDDYRKAVSTKNLSIEEWRSLILADYERVCTLYMEELNKAYETALDNYTEIPFKNHPEFKDQLFCFMTSQGYVEIKYVRVDGKEDRTQIESITPLFNTDYKTKEQAINYAFNDTMSNQFDGVLFGTSAGVTVYNDFVSNAKAVIMEEMSHGGGSGEMKVESISGIVSLGHNAATKGTTIVVNGVEYKVASNHVTSGKAEDLGMVVQDGEEEAYDVLQITIKGVDPKAVWNFAFAVAPQHVYGAGAKTPVDIENNKFGVDFGSYEFMKDVIQSQKNNKLPVGAGAYKATDINNNDNPNPNDFYSSKIVYFKANNYFHTVGEGINNPKIEKVRYQVISANNALQMLERGDVHYVTPQLTKANFEKIQSLTKIGADYVIEDQLGYGYIGVSAKYVPDIYLRRAIMCAMNTASAISYYSPDTAERIFWPMSTVSWAYPKDPSGENDNENGWDYPMVDFDINDATRMIQDLMANANNGDGYKKGDSALKLTFTIAGSNISDHPSYAVLRDAATLLNSLGWEIKVQADTMALTKLATGSLAVWAAAWGSTIDPDLYQVYHKNSSATSIKAWGYPEIKNGNDEYQKDILNELSDLIERARSTNDKKQRSVYYRQAMEKILELAVELPVYQRSVVYVYNELVIDSNTLPKEVNPYSSPLDRIWEIDFVK